MTKSLCYFVIYMCGMYVCIYLSIYLSIDLSLVKSQGVPILSLQ